MRSFPVRSASLLAIAILLAALFLRSENPGAPGDAPPPADPRQADRSPVAPLKTLLSPPPGLGSIPSNDDATIAQLRSRIADADRETSGFFLEEIERVLSDPGLSVAVEDFRLPARDGTTAMLDAFPDGPADGADEQRNLALVYVASAFRGCDSDLDCLRRFEELSDRCPWLAVYLSRQ